MTYDEFKTKYNIHSLNTEQEKAVKSIDGYNLILAVPGSGKTTVLVTRLGYMVLACGINPKNILTMTYTKAATVDMKKRFADYFGTDNAYKIEFRTINGVCSKIIKHYEYTKRSKAFSLMEDEKYINTIIRDIYLARFRDYPTNSEIKEVRTLITYVKNQDLTRDEIKELETDIPNFYALYCDYQDVLLKNKIMDYDDQMVYAYRILKSYPDILNFFREQFKYICVDEAQDTSKIQHSIIELLANGYNNLFMVGDEDQSIYGYRAAYPKALLDFKVTHPNANILLMEHNYRTTKAIIDKANSFIKLNRDRYEKEIRSTRGDGNEIKEISLKSRVAQYSYILKIVQDNDEEIAFLYRDNDSCIPLIDLFERNNISYRCRQLDDTFFSNRVVQDILNMIRFAYNPTDIELFMGIYYKFGAGITKEMAEFVRKSDRKTDNLFELLLANTSASAYTKRRCKELIECFDELKNEKADRAVYKITNYMGYGEYLKKNHMDDNKAFILRILGMYEASPMRLIERLEELKEIIKTHQNEGNIVLSTIHSSKGLEYKQVYIIDAIDGVFPRDVEENLEEERRIFYVGMTRAKDKLSVFTYKDSPSAFSRFLFPAKGFPFALNKVNIHGKRVDTGFYVGERVVHKKFGKGRVNLVNGDTIEVIFGKERKSFSAKVVSENKLLTEDK